MKHLLLFFVLFFSESWGFFFQSVSHIFICSTSAFLIVTWIFLVLHIIHGKLQDRYIIVMFFESFANCDFQHLNIFGEFFIFFLGGKGHSLCWAESSIIFHISEVNFIMNISVCCFWYCLEHVWDFWSSVTVAHKTYFGNCTMKCFIPWLHRASQTQQNKPLTLIGVVPHL